jgi:hypothetical protein
MQNYICYTVGRAGSTHAINALTQQKYLHNFDEVFKVAHNVENLWGENPYLQCQFMQKQVSDYKKPYSLKIHSKQYPYLDHKWFWRLIGEPKTVSYALYRNDLIDWVLSYIFALETMQWHSDEKTLPNSIPTYRQEYKTTLEKLKNNLIQFTFLRDNFDHVIEYNDIQSYFHTHFNVDTTKSNFVKLYTKEEKLFYLKNIDLFMKDFLQVFEDKQFLNL